MEKVNTLLLVMLIVIGLAFWLSSHQTANRSRPTQLLSNNQAELITEQLERTGVKPLAKLDTKVLMSNAADIQQFCSSVLQYIVQEDFESGFDLLAKRSIHPKSLMDKQRDLTKRQISLLAPRFGKAIGYELVNIATPCGSIMKYTYIVKHERHALRWRFTFYKPKEKWILNTFRWDDKITEL